MPIKNDTKRKAYFRDYMQKRRAAAKRAATKARPKKGARNVAR